MFCAAVLAPAQTPVKYTNLEIMPWEAGKGIDFPPDFQAKIIESLVQHFQASKKFAKIVKPGEAPPAASEPTVKLTAVLTEIDEGSRAARALVGFGAGSSYMKATVKFVDAASGKVKYESEVKGTYKGTWSVGGGSAANVADGLAKQIVKLAKDKL